jgi:glycosidase
LNEVGDIQQNLLNFLENHDEQRLASSSFLGDANKGVAAMILTACLNTNPIMVYAGQELGEEGMDVEGFSGKDGRTSIFDYWSVDKFVRWNNNGKWNNEKLTSEEVKLKELYTSLLQLCNKEKSFSQGKFYDLMSANYNNPDFNSTKKYAFLRGDGENIFLVVVNFNDNEAVVKVNIPEEAYTFFGVDKNKLQQATPLLIDQESMDFKEWIPLKLKIEAHSGEVFKIH